MAMMLFASAAGALVHPTRASTSTGASVPQSREVVYLLHGIGKSKFDMLRLQMALRREGYQVVNWQYPSRRYSICELAGQLAAYIQAHPAERISFVTHSMGGIVVRTYLSNYRPSNVHRFVMIAPPNQGAWLANRLSQWRIFRWYFGPAGLDLCEGDAGKCVTAGIPECTFGIIAGGRQDQRGMNPFIPGDNDGTISVDCTSLPGAADFVVLPYCHPFIQMMPSTIRYVTNFLKTGCFHPAAPAAE